jgi:hypothetical protein
LDAASLYFGGKLLEIIRAKQAEMSKPLLLGQALDYPDYKARAGYLKGLADVVGWMKSIDMEDKETASAWRQD